MEYKKISSKVNRYIITINLLVATFLNVVFLVISIFFERFIEINYKITINFIGISFIIFIYLTAFLRSNSLINNYKYYVTNDKIEVIKGVLIVSRKIMFINRIFKIEIKRGLIDRIFKIACIKFYSNGGNIKICYIDYDEAERIENLIKKEWI